MPQWSDPLYAANIWFLELPTVAHINGPKKDFCPKSRDGNIATHKVDIYSLMKTSIEFCYGGGAREPLWAPRLYTFIFHKCISLSTVVVSILAFHAGDRGSIPRWGATAIFY